MLREMTSKTTRPQPQRPLLQRRKINAAMQELGGGLCVVINQDKVREVLLEMRGILLDREGSGVMKRIAT